MFGEIRSVYDDLARVTAQIDQAQATIDEDSLVIPKQSDFSIGVGPEAVGAGSQARESQTDERYSRHRLQEVSKSMSP
jgi:hypothetical protein